MLLIATDEAGYGPKLGPLVIAATAWQVPAKTADPALLESLFAPLRQPLRCDRVVLTIDDSKAVYRPGGGLSNLHAAVSVSHHWCEKSEPSLSKLLLSLASEDAESVAQTPWLNQLGDTKFLPPAATKEVREIWGETGVSQLDTQARVITAAQLNRHCDGSANKADLLSESTLLLVRKLIDAHQRGSSSVAVFCDRHGGRRYYAGVLQHAFPETNVQVIRESSKQSVYRLGLHSSEYDPQEVTVHFTVKGDSFTPVALSSIHAKYLRERFMESFNRYFADLHRGTMPLRPTAGYPVDAERFLDQIADTLQREKIGIDTLVRSR